MEQVTREHEEAEELLPPMDGEVDDDAPEVAGDGKPEAQGVADADELLLAQIEDGSEDLGLDVETGLVSGAEAFSLVDDTEEEGAGDDASGVSLGAEDAGAGIDGGEEDGWIADSEGDSELYQSDFGDDDTDSGADDGGLEGTEAVHGADDPLHDGLDEDALPPLHADDGEDTIVEEIEPDLLREISALD